MRTSRFVTVAALAVVLSAGLGGLLGKSALAKCNRLTVGEQGSAAAVERETAEADGVTNHTAFLARTSI